MSDVQLEDFLAHYGVAGMRWGKRKGGSSSSASKAAGKIKSKWDSLSPESKSNAKKTAVLILAAAGAQTVKYAIGKSVSSQIGKDFASEFMLGDMGASLAPAKLIRGVAQVTSVR